MTWRNVSPEELKRLEAMEGKEWQAASASDVNKHIEKSSKYHNQKTDGFDSKKEARRAEELRMMEKAGIIRNLRTQVPFVLLPPFRHKGKWYSGIKYFADFVYIQDGKEVCEDVKSPITAKNPVYRMKRKMLLFKYPDINFIET